MVILLACLSHLLACTTGVMTDQISEANLTPTDTNHTLQSRGTTRKSWPWYCPFPGSADVWFLLPWSFGWSSIVLDWLTIVLWWIRTLWVPGARFRKWFEEAPCILQWSLYEDAFKAWFSFLFFLTVGTSLVSQMVRVCLQYWRPRFNPWVGKIPWRRKWQPTPVLPGKSHGRRSLAGYNLWGWKESDMTEATSSHFISLTFVHFCSTRQNLGSD